MDEIKPTLELRFFTLSVNNSLLFITEHEFVHIKLHSANDPEGEGVANFWGNKAVNSCIRNGDADHMTSIMSSKSISVASARKSWAVPLFFIALMGWMTTPTASAGHFNQLAHAKYMFIGVVTEAKMEARADSASGVAEGSKRSSRGIHYVKALVSPQRTLTDAPEGPVGSQNVYVCAADISVGATYLFILGDPDEKRGCFHSVPFLLGALPGKSPNSSIVLTADTIFMMPESPNLDQFPIAMPDANVSGDFCKRKIVVLHSYMDLHVFLHLLKDERAKGTNKRPIKGDGA